MLSLIREYGKLDRSIHNIIVVEFFVQMINLSFMAILPLYMKVEGYTDAQYAHFTSYRYLGMLALALGLGMYIKGRKILPMFYIATVGVPFFGLLILIGVHIHSDSLLLMSHLLWGTAYTFIQIPVLPYILRNVPVHQHTSAITLNFATWSLASILSFLFIGVFNTIDPVLFNEKHLLFGIVILSFSSIYFILRVNKDEHVPVLTEKRSNIKGYDWKLIFKAMVPTSIIAFGAGFTIPFISLFFSNVHHMSTAEFSYMSFAASFIVAYAALWVPKIKEGIGYKRAVPLTQSLAIMALVVMATTQYYSHISTAVVIAIIFYLIRQPLMNIAAPMTSDITMKYVGASNREMTSGLTSAIWSGSTFFSAIIFGILRHMNVDYVNIFLITAALYSIGVIWYMILIHDYHKREKMGLIS
ncbi:MAG: multidrug transporter [Bacteroidota bacterium]|jgi:MFS family permease|nr:multidrug transporter [Bacteroidota bacterium]